jgi:four helix bundle protein
MTAFEDLKVLQAAEQVADQIWREVLHWDKFSRDVVGKQMARSADSIGANISEAFGRFHYSEKLNFLYYARGSLFETKYWLNRCAERRLFSTEQSKAYADQLTTIARQINRFADSLKSQKRNSQAIKEPSATYLIDSHTLFSDLDLVWLSKLTSADDQNLQSPISNLHPPGNLINE